MAEDNQRADSLRRLAVIFQDIVSVADDYDKLGSIKDHIRSIESKREEVLTQKAQAEKELDEVRVLVYNTREQVSRMLADANAHAKHIADDAATAVESAWQVHEERLTRSQAEYEAERDKTHAELNAKIAEKRTELNHIEDMIDHAQDDLDAIQKAHADQKALLDEVEAQLSKLDQLRKR